MPESHSSPAKLLVTHVGTHDKSGGAAIAAWRLHLGLRETGGQSRVVTRFRSWPGDDVSCISSDIFTTVDSFHRDRVSARQPPDGGYFSFAPVSIPLLEHPWIAAADVVHFHWIARFISPEDIATLCRAGKTVFMSLHDEWAFTGGCHYVGRGVRGEDEWNGIHQIDEDLRPLALLERERKRRAFSSSRLHVIAPSRWIAREAAASGIFSPESIHVVPYGFDLSIFHAGDAVEERPEAGEVTLAFGCQSVDDRRKGYQEFREALALCAADPDFAAAAGEGGIRVITFGFPPRDETLAVPVIHRGELTEEGVADLLRESSAFVCPTLDDNLPNVVMESLSCGCPVLGFSTGGLPDMVTEGVDGLLAPQGDVPALADVIRKFCLDAVTRRRLREGARSKDFSSWTLATQARRMTELYQSALPAGHLKSVDAFPEAPATLDLECPLLPSLSGEIVGLALKESRARNQAQEHQIGQMTAGIEDLKGKLGSIETQLMEKSRTEEKLANDRLRLLATIDKQQKQIGEMKKRMPVSIRKRLRRFFKGLRRPK